jgi:hypothetical protein
MINRAFFLPVAVALALLGCRDQLKEIVVVDSELRRGPAAACDRCAASQADVFEHLVAADAGQDPHCQGIVIVENRSLRAGPVYQPMRRPHWVLAIGYVPSGEGQTWLLAHNETGLVRGYGEGTAPEIARDMCTALRERGLLP